MNLVFRRCRIRPWRGYYRRIPGDRTAFHVGAGGALPFAYLDRPEGRGTCHLVESDAAYELAQAVRTAKVQLGGWGGGSFLINEHGQVLVPASDGCGNVMLAGEIEGSLEFEDPFRPRETLNLADDGGLKPGDPWDRPYVGMWYNLSKHGRIYRMRSGPSGQDMEAPPAQDSRLVRALRSLRSSGPVRFVVNPHGIVLTKRPPHSTWGTHCEDESWLAVYVGRISRESWFAKEE